MTRAPIEDASVERARGCVCLTQSAEPPYTCSVCTVVWEEEHREMLPYPEIAIQEMNSIGLTVLWTDNDEMLQLGIRLASRAHMLYHETYIYPEELMAFAKGMMTFPQSASSEVIMESGSRDPKLSDYIRLRAFVLTSNGHSAIEVESEIRGVAPLLAKSHFFIPGLPADFNRVGADIARWIANRNEPLHVEWRDG